MPGLILFEFTSFTPLEKHPDKKIKKIKIAIFLKK
jgi:hypothetical protein